MDCVGPLDEASIANLYVFEEQFEEAHNVGNAVNGPFSRAVVGGRGIRQAERPPYKGGLAYAGGANDGNVDGLHGGGSVAVGGLEGTESAFYVDRRPRSRRGLTPEDESDSTSPVGWRYLLCVGDSGPSVSEDESRLCSEVSSLAASTGWGKWYRWKNESSVISSRSRSSACWSWSTLGTAEAEYARVFMSGRWGGRPAVLSRRGGCILAVLAGLEGDDDEVDRDDLDLCTALPPPVVGMAACAAAATCARASAAELGG